MRRYARLESAGTLGKYGRAGVFELGHRFEHLAAIIAGVKNPERLGVCIDTCHTFAAGYPLSPRRMFIGDDAASWIAPSGSIAFGAIHLNDSKKPLGSRRRSA